MRVTRCDRLPQGTIGLSAQLKKDVTIPDSLPYEMYADGTNLHLGPVIALLVAEQGLTPKTLHEYRGYLADYEAIKGLIYLCSLNGINPGQKTIEGYCYNPKAGGEGAPWRKGIFPYPDVVYRRIRVSRSKRYDDLLAHTGGKIFNAYYLNKWELWDSIRSHPPIGGHLPHTRLLDHPRSLKEMLASYGSVYLKPATGSMGKGIVKLDKSSDGYLFWNRHKAKTFASSENKAWAWIRRIRKGKKYLIQQSVAMTYQNKHVDFRVILQKNGGGQWICSGIIARYGLDGRFYTNDISSISPGRDALRTVFRLTEEEVIRKEAEMISICTTACQFIEQKYGPFGDVGLDVSVDENLKVWLLEINSCHQHTIPYYLNDLDMYRKVITLPLEYAKSWAGFTEENIARLRLIDAGPG
ncbi:YheC/YheD family protein [Paenibacillus flagellatus]|nr:YheC/YheD family protein [Paenibacillus flagellatus]